MSQHDLAADAVVSELVKQYQSAEGTISAEIYAAMTAEKPYTPRKLNQAISRVRQAVERMKAVAKPLLLRSIITAYGEGGRQTNEQLSKVGVTVRDGLSPQDRRALEILAQNASTKIDEIHNLVGRRVEGIIRQEGLRAAETVIKEKSAGAGAKQLQEALKRHGLTAQVQRGQTLFNVVPIKCKDGKTRNYLLSNYTEMVAQTTSREAHAHAVANRITEKFRAGQLSRDLVTFTTHAHACSDICAPYQGRTYSLTGADKKFPRLPVYPPLHPRCRHLLTPGPFFD